MVADELRRQADTFVELQDLAPSIMRAHIHRDDHTNAQPGGTIGRNDPQGVADKV
jgi:hypothetical protein